MRDSITDRVRRASLIVMFATATASAQDADSVRLAPNYWRTLTLGVTTSILLHEAGHVALSVIQGATPTFGFDNLRPTVFSGIDSHVEPRKQFYFSVAGLVVQAVLDEAILDIPHRRGGAFERGLLAGGIGTTVFYLTIGRRGSVSDVDFIARTGVMSKAEVTLLFGGIAAMHTWRIWRNPRYDHFFVRPRVDGRLEVGWRT
jgi:hypothetical protein